MKFKLLKEKMLNLQQNLFEGLTLLKKVELLNKIKFKTR